MDYNENEINRINKLVDSMDQIILIEIDKIKKIKNHYDKEFENHRSSNSLSYI